MAIGRLVGQQPLVETRRAEVLVWVNDPDDPTGFLLSPDAAIGAGLAMIAAGNRLAGHAGIAVDAAAITVESANQMSEDVAARLVFELNDAPFAIVLTAMQLTELAAALGALARETG